MRVQTTGYYDINKMEPIGLVQGISVHAISFFRGLFASLSGLAGGENPEIEKKYLDARESAMRKLIVKAKEMNADEIIGFEVETTELGRSFVVFIAAGTAMRHKTGKKGGGTGVNEPAKNIKQAERKKRDKQEKRDRRVDQEIPKPDKSMVNLRPHKS